MRVWSVLRRGVPGLDRHRLCGSKRSDWGGSCSAHPTHLQISTDAREFSVMELFLGILTHARTTVDDGLYKMGREGGS